ncbi:hypothetical protein PAECIP112173_04553 [Paenibacillus sp. JJ-100]|uniref:hypothetical protein n=1 Tax=Paenibacillus sp. JJ-100 TaxID=2974896 RepID=UPI0022FF9C4A|nr:hypothetical protein [Paenibacillus sp. JJ-100]CAI6085190.1 hypothetical protein PAECIP112173_04553 [Paenibacillus sp. JJ-100]
MKMKMPVMLHVVRALLSLKVIVLVYSMVQLQIRIRDAEANFLYLDTKSESLYYAFGAAEASIYVAFVPAFLAVISISCKWYKTILIILVIGLLKVSSSNDVLTILTYLFAILTILLHSPSKNYLRRQSTNTTTITT